MAASVENSIGAEIRKAAIQKYGTQSAAAKAWGVSKFMVSKVVNGCRTPNRPMLRDAGLLDEAKP